MAHGLLEEAAIICEAANTTEQLRYSQHIQQLTAPHEMGELLWIFVFEHPSHE